MRQGRSWPGLTHDDGEDDTRPDERRFTKWGREVLGLRSVFRLWSGWQ
jgi:hypothetical protein